MTREDVQLALDSDVSYEETMERLRSGGRVTIKNLRLMSVGSNLFLWHTDKCVGVATIEEIRPRERWGRSVHYGARRDLTEEQAAQASYNYHRVGGVAGMRGGSYAYRIPKAVVA